MKCPSCSIQDISFIGEIFSFKDSAGIFLGDIFKGVGLYYCRKCHLNFRWPRPLKTELDKLYMNGTPANWHIKPANRKDWILAKKILSSLIIPGKILDMGCWDGSFLNYLGPLWERYGIELNEKAGQMATANGIKIITRDVSNLDGLTMKYNAITAFDIIEHTYSPEKLLTDLSNLINVDGLIILSSGNTESFLWKMAKSKYWYCSIPEHLSFINISWAYYIADKLNLEIRHISKFAHSGNANMANSLREMLKYMIYLIFPYGYGYFRKVYNKLLRKQNRIDNSVYCHPPCEMNCKDHIFIVFKKK